ncbi:MAG TPA: N-acetylmuramoyl-L-alanine amidase, partial [Micromonosporaceae bacterium]|nr:N-acetylmuramoyl-L-alanine amidase [Micromonosporaceae bacterium]
MDDGIIVSKAVGLAGANLVGVTWSSAARPPVVSVRARTDNGWGDWTRLGVDEDHSPDRTTAEATAARAGTEPLIVGTAEAVQLRMNGGRRVRDLRLELVDPGWTSADANAAAATGDNATADLASLALPAPTIHSRAEWGADESLRDGPPRYGSTIYAGWVHHTVNANDYSSAEVPGIIRGIYAYHVISRGWSDIGYNFLVDRFGRLWEGRYGGIDEPVIGAHTLGFNTNTFAVSAIGNFERVSPPGAVNESIAALMAWKLGLYGRDPDGSTQALDGTWRPVIGGHRDAASTACPGQYLYARLPSIRDRAGAIVRQSQIGGDFALPVTGDVNGDGVTDLGWFQDGRWAFLAGSTVVRFGFGRAGDRPVVADFDNDGREEPGIFRAGEWHVRTDASAGPAWRVFRYGTQGDTPLAGRWPGSSGVGVAVVRGNVWHVRNGLGGGAAQWTFSYGRAGDIPLVGDWLDDNTARPAVVRGGRWYVATSMTRPVAAWSFGFGWPEDSPVAA